MFKVDFFIAGFPKTGTTSLASYLAQHEDICFSNPKEPGYFCDTFVAKRRVNSIDAYLGCWDKKKRCLVTGEGTVVYIYEENSIRSILEHNHDAKFIVMIRDPVGLVTSLHSNQLRAFEEDEENLENAWNLQKDRRNGVCVPAMCREAFFLQYREVASQGKYLQRMLRIVPRKQCIIVRLDDLITKPTEEYGRVLSFLKVRGENRRFFPAYHEHWRFKEDVFGKMAKHGLKAMRNPILRSLRRMLPVQSLGVERMFQNIGKDRHTRTVLPGEFQTRIRCELKEDIELLEDVAEVDLSRWKSG